MCNIDGDAVILGICLDKMLLLREQATVIKGEVLTDEERMTRLHELFERVKQRKLAMLDAGRTIGMESAGGQ
jgi:hypothetical protein